MKLEEVQSAGKTRGCKDATYPERWLELSITNTPVLEIGRELVCEGQGKEDSILCIYVLCINQNVLELERVQSSASHVSWFGSFDATTLPSNNISKLIFTVWSDLNDSIWHI